MMFPRLALFSLLAVLPLHAAVSMQPANPGVIPADRLSESWWAQRHQAVLAQIKAHPDTQLLMIGDSITNNYDKADPPDQNFQPTWQQFYAPRKAINLGFSGDTTGNLLWRLIHGELAGIHPRVAVLLIGTNNLGIGNQTAQQTETGIDAVIATLEERQPQMKILLLGILPTNKTPQRAAACITVNQYLAASYGENPRVTYLDIGTIFMRNGVLDTSIFYDPRLPTHAGAVHPDTIGQRRMAEAIEPTLAALMADTPREPLPSMTDINTALIPVPWLEQDSYDWYARHHQELLQQLSLSPRVVLLGDSITHFWGGTPAADNLNGPLSWQHVFGNLPTLNMGFGWDRTQNLLWRLRQGEFTGIHPDWVVLNIGTNNLTSTTHARANTPAEIVDGIIAIINVVHQRSPQSHIIVMAVFPRGHSPNAPLRKPIAELNALLAQRLQSMPAIALLDLRKNFLAPDGSLPVAIMPDGTHPSDAGYRIWADALISAGLHP